MFYRSESINIMDESHRPAWKHGTNFFDIFPFHLMTNADGFFSLANDPNELNSSSDGASTIGADILPFVDRRRPDMSKPTTVAGMNKKTALACWKVLHTKDKFGPGTPLPPWITFITPSRP
jgi:hypothetical protein